MVTDLQLICPECRDRLKAGQDSLCCPKDHVFTVNKGIHDLLPKRPSDIVNDDAAYHNAQKETCIEQHQTDTLRNLFFRRRIADFIAKRCTSDSNVLEIGGGVGFDLKIFLENNSAFGRYVFSDISSGILSYVYENIYDDRVFYCCIDGHNIPFEKKQFDFVYMIAALHHFPDVHKALEEVVRVTKDNGFIVFGIEPNSRLLRFLFRIKGPLVKLLPKKSHSPADECAGGFTIGDFKDFGRIYNLELVNLEPVWIMNGFVHYELEFLYRLLRLKKRIRLPAFAKKAFICLDKFLYKVPGARHLCWNYTVIYRKNGKK